VRETRAQVIAEHVTFALTRSALTERTYAQAVADLYHERTPLHARTVPFQHSKDPYADSEANRQTVKRMLDGRVRMAVDVEEALVLALPQPYRDHALTELSARLGLLAVHCPSHLAAGQQHQVGELLKHVGESMQRLAPLLEDGVIDARDAAYADSALRELDVLLGQVVTLRSAIRQYAKGEPCDAVEDVP
jgi:hypothetical protein